MSDRKGLAKNSLNAFESTVMGIAGTAPAFSVAVATATIVAAVGVLSVGSILYCGLVMFGIMLAFIHLSKITPHAGAAYAWVGHVFGRKWGFFAGWGLLVASIFFMVSATIPAATSTLILIAPEFVESAGWGLLVASTFFMVSATIPAATSTLLLIAPEQVENTTWVTFTAAVWLTVVTIVVTTGIKHASYAQLILTGLETAVIFALIGGAFHQYWGNPAHPPSLIWFSPFSFTPQLFATGALTAIFFYWGWDVTMNLSEEAYEGTASKGAFWAMVNLILFFIIMMIVVLIVLTNEEIAQANTNVLFAVATKLFPSPWNYLAVLSTILSTIGTIETQILQFSRSMFAMARDQMLPQRYAGIHAEWQTPWVATLVIWALGVLLLFSSSYMPSVKQILESSILAIGFQICFYMSLTGFACAWHYRNKLQQGMGNAISYVLWPLLAALFMVFIAIYSIPTFDLVTNVMGIGGILIGFLPLMLNHQRRAH